MVPSRCEKGKDKLKGSFHQDILDLGNRNIQ